jgi:hypothetical protein
MVCLMGREIWYLTNKIDPSNKKNYQTANGPQEVSIFCKQFVEDHSKITNSGNCMSSGMFNNECITFHSSCPHHYTHYLSQTTQPS